MLDDERDGYSHEDLSDDFSTSFEEGATCTCEDGEDGRSSCPTCS